MILFTDIKIILVSSYSKNAAMNILIYICAGVFCVYDPVDEIKTSFVVLLSLTSPIGVCLFLCFVLAPVP